jgi:hypothetical protein
MADAIIAIGGTGKRVASLYLKLVNTLRPANMTAPGANVFVIDMEPEPGTPDDGVNQELRREGVPDSHFISPVVEGARVQRTISLSDFMEFEKGGTTLPLAYALFNANQLNVQIIKGMNCEPTVGATVAARRFSTDVTETETAVQELENGIAVFDNVIIVGSIIGGTGAGVTPQLVKWIRHHSPSKKIYGLLFLRWIDLPKDDAEGASNAKMLGNTKAWLNYLLEHHPGNGGSRGELFTSYILIGAPQGMVLNKAHTDAHHPLHLLGAINLLQFDRYDELTAGSSDGPHFIELRRGYRPQEIKVGDSSMAAAVVWEKLFANVLSEFSRQQPAEALSPFTLMLAKRLSWNCFTRTIEEFASRWGRRNQLSADWKKMAAAFNSERKKSEDRVEELKKLTSGMNGADDIFDFDWNDLQRQYENKKATAIKLVKDNLTEVTVPSPDPQKSLPDAVLQELASRFGEQVRTILRRHL